MSMALALDLFEKRNLNAEIIDQLRCYPANDQWLAFSEDAKELLNEKYNVYNSLADTDNFKELRRVVVKHGLGLILVGKQEVEFVEYPKSKKGRFLHMYAKENDIVQQLGS